MGLRAKNGTFCLHILLDLSGQKSNYKANQPLGTSHTMLPSLVKTKLKPTGWKLALKPTKRSVLQNFGCIFFFNSSIKLQGTEVAQNGRISVLNDLAFFCGLMMCVTQMELCGCHKTPSILWLVSRGAAPSSWTIFWVGQAAWETHPTEEWIFFWGGVDINKYQSVQRLVRKDIDGDAMWHASIAEQTKVGEWRMEADFFPTKKILILPKRDQE